jgi:hypothetical protein
MRLPHVSSTDPLHLDSEETTLCHLLAQYAGRAPHSGGSPSLRETSMQLSPCRALPEALLARDRLRLLG